MLQQMWKSVYCSGPLTHEALASHIQVFLRFSNIFVFVYFYLEFAVKTLIHLALIG